MSKRPFDSVAAARLTPRILMYPFDWIVIGYCTLMTVVLLLTGRPIRFYLDELAFYVGAGLLSLLVARRLDETHGGWEAFLRLLYPALLFTFFYRATGGLMHLVHPVFFDSSVAAFERQVLGFNPTLYFDQHWQTPWLTEILMFCYGSYYVMLPAFLIPVFLRRDYHVIREFMAAATLTFFASYLLFFLFPVAGPRWHFADAYLHPVEGPLFTRAVQFIIERGAVFGGAMPSSHTGVALVVLACCYRYYRRVGLLLIPLVTGLAIGAVWGRFHYLSDIVVGAAIGTAAVAVTRRYLRTDPATASSTFAVRESETEHAS